jgi:hypothetical protein
MTEEPCGRPEHLYPRRSVLDALDHQASHPLPRGELFLGFDFLDRYWREWKGNYMRQLRSAAEYLGLSLVGIDLNPQWSLELAATCGYSELRDYFTVGCVNGPVAGVIERIGFSKAMVSVRKDRAMFSDIMGVITDEIMSTVDLVEGNGLGAIAVTDDIAGSKGLLFSLKDFLDLMLPMYEAIAAASSKRGMRAIFHCDGDTVSIIGPLAAAGYRCFHPVDAQAGMDLYELKKNFGERVAFMGHIDLMAWEADRVAGEIARAESVFDQGGLIIGSSGGISLSSLGEGARALYPSLSGEEG